VPIGKPFDNLVVGQFDIQATGVHVEDDDFPVDERGDWAAPRSPQEKRARPSNRGLRR
jgi:hypothetical protein